MYLGHQTPEYCINWLHLYCDIANNHKVELAKDIIEAASERIKMWSTQNGSQFFTEDSVVKSCTPPVHTYDVAKEIANEIDRDFTATLIAHSNV